MITALIAIRNLLAPLVERGLSNGYLPGRYLKVTRSLRFHGVYDIWVIDYLHRVIEFISSSIQPSLKHFLTNREIPSWVSSLRTDSFRTQRNQNL